MGLSAPARTPASRLLAWWLSSQVRRERDRLPWRSDTVGPWGVLVSETMLAQTQLSRVAERYPPFLRRFASPAHLAGEPLGELLRTWEGLGYPRRAVNLYRCAGVIVAEHSGEVPSDLASLLALPGVGRYTARAVLAFAFDEATMPIDTNVGRVLARLIGRPLAEREVQAVGDAVLSRDELAPAGPPPPAGGRVLALAFMDLGATLCRPSAPRCQGCPLRPSCSWGRAQPGATAPDPAKGSARVSKAQAPFPGSDRQGRGRLLRAAARGRLAESELAAAAGWPEDPARARRVTATLVADGLLSVEGSSYGLP